MTAYRPGLDGRYAVIGCKLKQNANEGCNGCASIAGLVLCFIACFILLVIAPLLLHVSTGYRSLSMWYFGVVQKVSHQVFFYHNHTSNIAVLSPVHSAVDLRSLNHSQAIMIRFLVLRF